MLEHNTWVLHHVGAPVSDLIKHWNIVLYIYIYKKIYIYIYIIRRKIKRNLNANVQMGGITCHSQ